MIVAILKWYFEWALPGLGMFSEAYIVFSSGQIGPFQQALWPTCYKLYQDCDAGMIKHVAGYIQICGIMAGMLLWGVLGDITGRKWGSRCVASIMLSGTIMLTFTPYAKSAVAYFQYFMVSQTWYGFGVGGEYPMASSSAAERAEMTPELQAFRGRQVILVFSNQGMGNLTNSSVILICMAIFGQTGLALSFEGSRHVLALTYGVGAIFCLIMVTYRMIFLHESKMFKEEMQDEKAVLEASGRSLGWQKFGIQLWYFWPRQFVASVAWIANDFAFYGNKLFQSTFINILYPGSPAVGIKGQPGYKAAAGATQFTKQKWTVLNSAIALMGYYTAAWLVDKPWYGRRRMQIIGFLWMFVLYLICAVRYDDLTASESGLHAFQFLYYFSSYWNQFGPNATTWLVAGEMFPTDMRATYHGFAACMGKLGAIISALWFSYVSNPVIFYLSAAFGIGGALVTYIWLADTTGLDLVEYDRLNHYILTGRFHEYHGEAVNPRYLSPWEIYLLGWSKNYNPEQDRLDREREAKELHMEKP